MSRLETIDPNFKVPATADRPGLRWKNALDAPFGIYGVYYDGDRFRRLPKDVAKRANPGVLALHANTAGGRLRFVTDSPYVAIHAEMANVCRMPHFAFTGSAGFDLYVGNAFYGSFMPPFEIDCGYESVLDLPAGQKEITVHFPLYSDVKALYVGLMDGCALLPPRPYRSIAPIVYYGSSITQGGCASRPGLAYQNILTRETNADHINLGFSGSAKGEDVMAEYIAGLGMSVFVYDYDHNAPTPEHLAATHEKLFKTVRAAHPALPVVMLSRPVFTLRGDEPERLAVIKRTFGNAKAAGDENVYLLEGPALMADCGPEGTVDACHPNDLGFRSMARALEPVLEAAFRRS